MILIIVFICEFLSYYQIFMLLQKPHINDRFDIYAVGAVVLLEHNALLTDVIHKSAVAVRYEKLRFFSVTEADCLLNNNLFKKEIDKVK